MATGICRVNKSNTIWIYDERQSFHGFKNMAENTNAWRAIYKNTPYQHMSLHLVHDHIQVGQRERDLFFFIDKRKFYKLKIEKLVVNFLRKENRLQVTRDGIKWNERKQNTGSRPWENKK